jgi:hypothetical protein
MNNDQLLDTMLDIIGEATEQGRVKDGMTMLRAVDLVYRHAADVDPGFGAALDQLHAAFDEAFNLTEADWIMFDLENDMALVEERPDVKRLFMLMNDDETGDN